VFRNKYNKAVLPWWIALPLALLIITAVLRGCAGG
jgi:hypothetical protein